MIKAGCVLRSLALETRGEIMGRLKLEILG